MSSDLIQFENFWQGRFAGVKQPNTMMITGWSVVTSGLPAFQEAPLEIDNELSGTTPDEAEIILISAPGAVGKSTFAKELAFRTGAVLLDLAKAEPVGANTISGGLARCNIFNEWRGSEVALVVDGIDEARIRVAREGFEAFLSDLIEAAKGRSLPTIVLGRTGAVQDSWVALSETGVKLSILELGFFDRNSSVEFAKSRMRVLKPESSHPQAEDEAIGLLVDKIRSETEADNDRFSGYAPVLMAIADRVAKEDNPSALTASIQRGERPVTLRSIIDFILERERGKLSTLPFEDAEASSKLYQEREQLSRLSARVYGMILRRSPA